MVLLTSSQVNVAISSGIVVLFTLALFLSGYAIQQRTVRHLRAAIRPDNTPQLYLPDRFHDDTTELADGTIVMLDEYNRPVRMKNGRLSIGKGEEPKVVKSEEEREAEEVVIEVTESIPDVLSDEEKSAVGEGAVEMGASAAGEEQKVLAVEELLRGEEGIGAEAKGEGQITEESQQQQQPSASEVAPPPAPEEPIPEEKPMSRAERRRLIKEEIQRLAQGAEPVYYQRRLW